MIGISTVGKQAFKKVRRSQVHFRQKLTGILSHSP
jgi:hypothetical protein